MFSLILSILSCAEPPTCAGERLFGAPNERTGLDASSCAPVCEDCGGAPWSPPSYDAADFAAWRALSHQNAPAPLTETPYGGADPIAPGPDAVCAVILDTSGGYTTQSFQSSRAAARAGGVPTHFGVCGLCSGLADLAVYAETPDLTEPVRACGLEHLDGDVVKLTACIQAIGFTPACASIWAYNTLNTRAECLEECLEALDQPYHSADGALNDCLLCDEEESGPVFQAVAGRTRRNTGLASSMCRPCAEVRPLTHEYTP
ncbi:MAG: hypothetical protein IPI35_22920 [Deltaproteobacteria bacterium]|nr:hypothetical protein [Deltaproteobacteria bacterium]